jgi:glycosyltransferase involved in cell wall biosynthesis
LNRHPRLTCLITDLALGGAEIQLVRLITYLKSSGWEISVISILPPEPLVEDLESIGIPIAYLLKKRRKLVDPRTFFRLVRLIRSGKPFVLLNFMFHANILGRIAGRIAGVPIIISSIRNEKFGGAFREFLERWTGRLDNITVLNSHFVAEKLINKGVIQRERIKVIYNGIPVNQFYSSPDNVRNFVLERLGLSPDRFIWLTVGRLETQKDYPTLFRALSKIVKQNDQTSLLIVGEGSLRKDLYELARTLSIEQNVHLLGYRRDVPDLMAAVDAFVLASSWEGLPNAVAEALASRKPVVVTSVGGLPEMVEDEISGIIVPPKNPDALAKAMMQIMNMPSTKRREMGDNGRKYIMSCFEAKQIYLIWEELLIRQIESHVIRRDF